MLNEHPPFRSWLSRRGKRGTHTRYTSSEKQRNLKPKYHRIPGQGRERHKSSLKTRVLVTEAGVSEVGFDTMLIRGGELVLSLSSSQLWLSVHGDLNT